MPTINVEIKALNRFSKAVSECGLQMEELVGRMVRAAKTRPPVDTGNLKSGLVTYPMRGYHTFEAGCYIAEGDYVGYGESDGRIYPDSNPGDPMFIGQAMESGIYGDTIRVEVKRDANHPDDTYAGDFWTTGDWISTGEVWTAEKHNEYVRSAFERPLLTLGYNEPCSHCGSTDDRIIPASWPEEIKEAWPLGVCPNCGASY